MTITNFSNDVNINSEVEVTALYFRPEPRAHRLKSFPKRMNWGGREYNFAADGLRFLVSHGQQLVQLFDMSDGQATYRLRQDGDRWTLVGIRGAV
ncbi:MAG TPA: hypothetical protein VLG27_03285 [Candidatus Saccharimonadia bacterium]|nr:hypothetical protein [Patescibacteria group bacterium]HSX45998.1 hypothetical protein [Candidatus Saccharimonadia bacterium]